METTVAVSDGMDTLLYSHELTWVQVEKLLLRLSRADEMHLEDAGKFSV